MLISLNRWGGKLRQLIEDWKYSNRPGLLTTLSFHVQWPSQQSMCLAQVKVCQLSMDNRITEVNVRPDFCNTKKNSIKSKHHALMILNIHTSDTIMVTLQDLLTSV